MKKLAIVILLTFGLAFFGVSVQSVTAAQGIVMEIGKNPGHPPIPIPPFPMPY